MVHLYAEQLDQLAIVSTTAITNGDMDKYFWDVMHVLAAPVAFSIIMLYISMQRRPPHACFHDSLDPSTSVLT